MKLLDRLFNELVYYNAFRKCTDNDGKYQIELDGDISACNLRYPGHCPHLLGIHEELKDMGFEFYGCGYQKTRNV